VEWSVTSTETRFQLGQLTSGLSLRRSSARKARRVTASVPLKDATRLRMMLSILDSMEAVSSVKTADCE
jgi:hypothetical protein